MAGITASSKPSAKQKAPAIGLILVGLLIAGYFGARTLDAAHTFRGRPAMPPPGEVESDVELIRFLLTQILNYGAPLFGLTLCLAAMGVPISSSLLVIAMGAFSQQGIFSWPVMVAVGLFGVVLGDSLSYGMGHFAKLKLERRFGDSPRWKNARVTFDKHGAKAVFLTRFLLTAIATPTNLIAGGSGFGIGRFLVYDISGEFLWLVLYGGLGYLFGSQWETVNEFASDFGWFLLGVAILAAGFAWARRIFGRV